MQAIEYKIATPTFGRFAMTERKHITRDTQRNCHHEKSPFLSLRGAQRRGSLIHCNPHSLDLYPLYVILYITDNKVCTVAYALNQKCYLCFG
jgi:hypothetical protein